MASAQYSEGDCTVTNASQVVIGNDTDWLTEVAIPAIFKVLLDGESTYQIGSVVSATRIILSSNYSASTNSGIGYTIGRSFTSNRGFWRVLQGDSHFAEILSQETIDPIDEDIAHIMSGNATVDGTIDTSFGIDTDGNCLRIKSTNLNASRQYHFPDYNASLASNASMDAKVSDTIYGADWNGITTIAPSKNAVYDMFMSGNYYGVSWDESQASGGYTRTGRLLGVTAGQSLANALIPIQAAMRRCVINDSGVVQYYLDPSDSTLRVGGGAATLTGTDGQVMVEIPAFYYRYTYSGTTHTWEISMHPLSGFSLHPAFIKNDEFVPYRYIGAYEGTLYNDLASIYTNGLQLPAVSMTFANATSVITCASLSHPFTLLEAGDKLVVAGTVNNNGTLTVSSKTDQTITTVEALTDETAAATTLEIERNWAADILCSVSGKAPINNGTRANFRTAAATRGTGWRQQDYDLISAIQLLYLTEYASFYSQSMIGAGLTDWSSAWPAWNNNNPINVTGLTNSLGNATGNLSNGDGVIGSYMSYRGIENFFGHLWKWVDFVNILDHVPYVCNNDADVADNTLTNYTALGITLAAANGYQMTLEQQDRGFLPASVGGASNTYITDYYYQDVDWRVAALGGHANRGADAGVACWYLSSSSSDRDRLVAGRLCR